MQYGILHSVSLVFVWSGSSATYNYNFTSSLILSNPFHFATIWMCFNYYHTLEPLLLSLLALLFQLGRAKFSRCPFCPYCSSSWARPIFLQPMRLSTRSGSLYWLCALQQAHGYRADAGKGQPASHQCKAGCEVMPSCHLRIQLFGTSGLWGVDPRVGLISLAHPTSCIAPFALQGGYAFWDYILLGVQDTNSFIARRIFTPRSVLSA